VTQQRSSDRSRTSHTWPGSPLARATVAVASVAAAALGIPHAVNAPGDHPAPQASAASDQPAAPAALMSARLALPSAAHAGPGPLSLLPTAGPAGAAPAAPAPAAGPAPAVLLTSPLPGAPAGALPAIPAPAAAPALIPLPAVPAAPAPAAAPKPAAPAAVPVGKGAVALAAAMSVRGTPYVWGGTGKGGFDCSGLALWAYKKAGVTLPRSSRAQSSVGTPVSKGDLRPGDLVFFYKPVSHVGIYVGNGNVVHAVDTGDVVRVSPLSRMPYAGARRL
jgi:peptidoglycan DL-endopeptidase CwlO